MTLWIVNYSSGAPGCPLVLKGELNAGWEWNVHDPELPAAPSSTEYVYRARHRVLDFDYWDLNWMASDRFVDVCRSFDLRVLPEPVTVLQSDGTPTTKRYSYLRWGEWASIIDLDASEFTLERDPATGAPASFRFFPGAPALLSVERFVADPSRIPEQAAFRCLDLDSQLVCTDAFRSRCEAAGLVGLAFSDVAEYRKADFWG